MQTNKSFKRETASKEPATVTRDATTFEDKTHTGVQHKSSVTLKDVTTDSEVTDTNMQQTSAISTTNTGVDPEITRTSIQQTSVVSAVSAGVSPDITNAGIQHIPAIPATEAGVDPMIAQIGIQQTSAISTVSAGVTPDITEVAIQHISAVSPTDTGDNSKPNATSTKDDIGSEEDPISQKGNTESRDVTAGISTEPDPISDSKLGELPTDQITEKEGDTTEDALTEHGEVPKAQGISTQPETIEPRDMDTSIADNLSGQAKGNYRNNYFIFKSD